MSDPTTIYNALNGSFPDVGKLFDEAAAIASALPSASIDVATLDLDLRYANAGVGLLIQSPNVLSNELVQDGINTTLSGPAGQHLALLSDALAQVINGDEPLWSSGDPTAPSVTHADLLAAAQIVGNDPGLAAMAQGHFAVPDLPSPPPIIVTDPGPAVSPSATGGTATGSGTGGTGAATPPDTTGTGSNPADPGQTPNAGPASPPDATASNPAPDTPPSPNPSPAPPQADTAAVPSTGGGTATPPAIHVSDPGPSSQPANTDGHHHDDLLGMPAITAPAVWIAPPQHSGFVAEVEHIGQDVGHSISSFFDHVFGGWHW